MLDLPGDLVYDPALPISQVIQSHFGIISHDPFGPRIMTSLEHDVKKAPSLDRACRDGAAIPFNKPFIAGKELFYIARAVTNGNVGGDGEFTEACQPISGTPVCDPQGLADSLLHRRAGDGRDALRARAGG